MKEKSEKRKTTSLYSKRFLRKLFLYFLLFSIPILIIIFLTWHEGSKALEGEFEGRIQSNIVSAGSTIDTYLDSTRNIGQQFFSNDVVVNYFKPQKSQDLLAKSEQWKIKREVSRMENIASGYLDHLYVFFEEDNIVYTRSGTMDKDLLFSGVIHYEGYDQDFWHNAPTKGKSFALLPPMKISGLWSHGGMTIPAVSRGRAGRANAIMVANLSNQHIQELLEGTAIVDATEFYIIDSQGTLFFSNTERPAEEVEEFLSSCSQGTPSNSTVHGTKYITAVVPSVSTDWFYITAVPVRALRSATSFYSEFTLFAGVLLLAGSFVLAYVYSLRLYRPVERALELLTQGEIGLISPTAEGEYLDEFDFLKTGIEHLSFGQRQSQEKSDWYSSEYVEQTFRLLIEGIVPGNLRTFEVTLTNSYHFENLWYQCVVFHFDFSELFYAQLLDTARIEVLSKLGVVLQLVIGDTVPCYVMDPVKSTYVTILNIPEEGYDLESVFQSLEKLFKNDFDFFDVNIGIGLPVETTDQLLQSYNQAVSAVHKTEDAPFSYTYFQGCCLEQGYLYTIDDQKRLLNSLKSLNQERAKEVTRTIIGEHFKSTPAYEQTENLYKQMVNTGIQFLQEHGKYTTQLSSEEFVQSVLQSQKIYDNSAQDTQQLLEFFGEAIALVSRDTENQGDTLAEDISDYVKNNYTQDLGLEQIADEIGVTMKYVSRVFKQSKGINLSDYINDLRVEHAKQLLCDTDELISDIGPKVGIHNRTTFIRVFKRHTGITPNEYRRVSRKEKEQ